MTDVKYLKKNNLYEAHKHFMRLSEAYIPTSFPEEEIEEAAENRLTFYGKLEDKFGDNGVVTIAIGRPEEDTLHMELWLMSCRVLKRDVELALLDAIVHRCQAKGFSRIKGYYYPTAKNAMVKNFYGDLGFEKLSEDENGNSTWEFKIPEGYENKNKVIEVTEE